MAKELEDLGSWQLPCELKYGDLYSDQNDGLDVAFAFPTAIPFLFAAPHSPVESMTETETESEDDQDYLAGLTQSMAQSCLHDEDEDDEKDSDKAKNSIFTDGKVEQTVMPVSPQSTLCSHLSTSVNLPNAVNGPSATSQSSLQLKDHIDQQTRKPILLPKNTTGQNHTNHQLPLAWAEAEHNKSRKCVAANYRALGLPSSAWPPLQKQSQQSSQSRPQPKQQQKPIINTTESKSLFLNTTETKKESTGTGVFLPRVTSGNFEPRRKTVCSTVLVPARVVQALNLNLEALGAQPTFTNAGGYAGFLLNHDALLSRASVAASSYRNRNNHFRSQASTGVSPDVQLLPHEWTY